MSKIGKKLNYIIMSTKIQKKLQLSDIQKDVKKRLKDFDAHRAKLNAMRSNIVNKPKSKSLISSFLGL